VLLGEYPPAAAAFWGVGLIAALLTRLKIAMRQVLPTRQVL
jgi:hypothetical protein